MIKSFANMVKRKAKIKKEECPNFPFTPNELIQETEKGPMCDLFNVIFMTLKDSLNVNEYGYAETRSRNIACKIWSLANDWEALILRDKNYRNPKQVLIATTVHRLTRSKEVINYLSKCNVCIPYKDIRRQNKAWEEIVIRGENSSTQMTKGAVTHSSIDNIDEETESVSLHYTNSNLYQPNATGKQDDSADIINLEQSHPGATEEIPVYQIGKLSDPSTFQGYVDDESTQMIDDRFSVDLLWSIASGIPDTVSNDENLPVVGPWTHFNKQLSSVHHKKTLIQYMPVVPQPVSDYAVLQSYLLFLVETTENLELKHIFTHCDEAVYSKLLHIIWNHKDEFKKVIPIMGAFHQMLCFQKIMYKRFGCLGIDKWVSAAGTTKSPSAAEKAVHGRHYNTCTRVYKEIFDAIVQMRTEDVTSNYEEMDKKLLDELIALRKQVASKNADRVLQMEEFHNLKGQIVATTGKQSQITLMLLKDISLMLSFIAAAREADIDLHLECERQFVQLVHAFDHIHYARYCTFQHVYLSDMKRQSTEAYKDLKNVGFTASQTGGKFNAVHGDYICERQNAATKSAGGPLKSGFGTSISAFNTWVRTRHIGVEIQNALRKFLNIKTTSTHKDSTPAGIRKHTENVKKLKVLVRQTYRYDFFAVDPVRAITSGKEVDSDIVDDLLTSKEKGNKSYKQFVQERLVLQTSSIFDKIPKMKIKTGLKKLPKPLKPVEALKEDVQGFGILAEQKTPLKEAFQYPITTLPLSIAESSVDLRGATKSKFRNHIIEATDAATHTVPQSAVWIYDAGKIIRSVPPQSTYKLFFDEVLERMTPPKHSNAQSVHIVLDKYINNSTKGGARKARGEDSSARLFITGFGQSMPLSSEEWQSALANSETKKHLLALFTSYVLSVQACLYYPTVINDEDETWLFDPKNGSTTKLFECNHEEADTRMMYHSSLQGTSNVVISANDTDVLFLGAYACALDPSRNWFLNYQSNTFANMKKVADSLGNTAIYLPIFHCLTGCDTTSYYHFRGKTLPWERAAKLPESFKMIQDLGCGNHLSEESIDSAIEFVRRFVYCGKKGEDLIDTKIRMYKAQSKKKTSTLPPDPNSIRYDILRKHHQAYTWRRCLERIIVRLPLAENGWKEIDGRVLPIWYTCTQLPPALQKKSRSGYSADLENDGMDSNIDECAPEKIQSLLNDVSSSEPPKKRIRVKKNTNPAPTTRKIEGKADKADKDRQNDGYLADIENLVQNEDSHDDSSEWERLSQFSTSDSSDDSDW